MMYNKIKSKRIILLNNQFCNFAVQWPRNLPTIWNHRTPAIVRSQSQSLNLPWPGPWHERLSAFLYLKSNQSMGSGVFFCPRQSEKRRRRNRKSSAAMQTLNKFSESQSQVCASRVIIQRELKKWSRAEAGRLNEEVRAVAGSSA